MLYYIHNKAHHMTLDGLSMDHKVKNLEKLLGPELIINGIFDADTDWTKNAGWTISAGKLHSSGGGQATSQVLTSWAVSGKTYRTAFTISGYIFGTIRLRLGSTITGIVRNINGTFVENITYDGAGNSFNILSDSADYVGSIDNVSIREIL